VHYTGKLQGGIVFDSSQKIGREPLRFTLGVGQVIDGWDQGVIGMKVGGQRKLKIPPELGYGSQDLGVIPPYSTLIFEVELLEVE
jgi:FKBP-type peptidyl-prolyl cis-trans isomerase